jgi:hypothetical protein
MKNLTPTMPKNLNFPCNSDCFYKKTERIECLFKYGKFINLSIGKIYYKYLRTLFGNQKDETLTAFKIKSILIDCNGYHKYMIEYPDGQIKCEDIHEYDHIYETIEDALSLSNELFLKLDRVSDCFTIEHEMFEKYNQTLYYWYYSQDKNDFIKTSTKVKGIYVDKDNTYLVVDDTYNKKMFFSKDECIKDFYTTLNISTFREEQPQNKNLEVETDTSRFNFKIVSEEETQTNDNNIIGCLNIKGINYSVTEKDIVKIISFLS